MKLTNNFTLEELTKSQQAVRNGIDNTPDETVIKNLTELARNVLQPLRERLGMPVSVSSGYRSVELNKVIGGSNTSEHCYGYAADIEIHGMSNKQLFDYIKANFKFTQLILEFYNPKDENSGWVHVSYNPSNLKKQCLMAVKENGKTKYLPA